MFWANDEQHIPPAQGDIVQFWGNSADIGTVANITNKLVLSYMDYLYINVGFGFIWGEDFGQMITWAKIYDLPLTPAGISKDRILGAEATMWSEVNNENTLDDYLWVRSSAMAERLWHEEIDQDELALAQRLIDMKNLLNSRGINTQPVTVELCERHPTNCFAATKKDIGHFATAA